MKIQVKQKGPVAFSALTQSGHEVMMDASAKVGGENKGPRPMEMLLMGLGGCTAIDVVMILRKARQEVTDIQIEINAERAQTDPKVFTDIVIDYLLTGKNLSAERVQRAIDLSAEKYCSASIMLGKTATIKHHYKIKMSELS